MYTYTYIRSRKIPVLYLLRSAPPMASLMAFRVSTPEDPPERVRAIELLPVWPKTCQSRALAENVTLPSINVSVFALPFRFQFC